MCSYKGAVSLRLRAQVLLVKSECKVGFEPLQAERNRRTDSVEGLCESILITPRSNLIGSRKVWVNQIIVLKGAKDCDRHPTVRRQDVGSTASAHSPGASALAAVSPRCPRAP